MSRRSRWWWAALLFILLPAQAAVPGRFDYYVLSLSWSPQYCAGDARPDARQCGRPYAFVPHGLWPQYEQGWPDRCGRAAYLPDALIERMLRVMPSKPLILHEWRQHGVCSGLEADAYFDLLTQVVASIRIPAAYTQLDQYLSTTPLAIRQAFRAANPALPVDGIAVQCSGRYLQEVRICVDRQLQPRRCGVDVRDRCGEQVVLRPVRSTGR